MYQYVFVLIVVIFADCGGKREPIKPTERRAAYVFIFGDVLNVRAEPSIKAKVVAQLEREQKVEVLQEAESLEQVGQISGKWVKIKVSAGEGWVFGMFLVPDREYFSSQITDHCVISDKLCYELSMTLGPELQSKCAGAKLASGRCPWGYEKRCLVPVHGQSYFVATTSLDSQLVAKECSPHNERD